MATTRYRSDAKRDSGKSFAANIVLIISGVSFCLAGFFTFRSQSTAKIDVPTAVEAKVLPRSVRLPSEQKAVLPAPPEPSRLQAESKPASATTPPTTPVAPFDGYEEHRLYRLGIIAARVDEEYGDFFNGLQKQGKSPDKIRQLLIERLMISQDLFELAYPQGIDDSDRKSALAKLQQLSAQSRKELMEFEKEFRAKLGERDFASWRDYEVRKPERHLADELNYRLSGTSEQLTPDQRTRFVEAMRTIKNENGGRVSSDSVDGALRPRLAPGAQMRIIPYAALEAMRPLLTAAQLEQLRRIYTEQQRTVEVLRSRGVLGGR